MQPWHQRHSCGCPETGSVYITHVERKLTQVSKAARLFDAVIYAPASLAEPANATSDAGALLEHYPAASPFDDLFWAATWLYRAGGTPGLVQAAARATYGTAMSLTMDLAYAELDAPGASWDVMHPLATLHAATLTTELRYHDAAQNMFWDTLCDGTAVAMAPDGRALFPASPYLGSTAAVAAMSALYVKHLKPPVPGAEDSVLRQGLPL
jgi:hypothetical protein